MPEIITNNLGERITPSCVAFTNVDRLIGRTAVNNAIENSENTIFGMFYYDYLSKI